MRRRTSTVSLQSAREPRGARVSAQSYADADAERLSGATRPSAVADATAWTHDSQVLGMHSTI